MRIDFPASEIIHARARRERAEAVYALVFVPIARLVARLIAQARGLVTHHTHNRRAHA